MSILQMARVWSLDNLEPLEKLVMLAVADFSDDDGKAWPSIRTIARKSSLSEDSVRRKLRNLKKAGLVSITARKDHTGRDRSNLFRLFPNPSLKLSDLSESGSRLPSPPATQEGSCQSPPYLNHHIEPSKNMLSAFFETLWSEYPSKDGKKAALSHFKATVKSEFDCLRIRQALDNYLAMLSRETWRRPKNGSTWFNNWEDWESVEPLSNTAQIPRAASGNTLEELREKGIDV